MMMLQPGELPAQNLQPDTVHPDSIAPPEPAFDYDFAMDFGVSRIENLEGKKERFFATALMPEFYYGDLSAGLLVKMHVHVSDGTTRSEDYDSANDFLSLIRYVQYAEEDAAGYYARFGELEEASLGFGQFINLYQNSISLDEQKRGFEVNYNAGNYFVEGLYSNVLAPEVFGLRGAMFPFADDPLSRYKQLSVAFSLAGDLSSQGLLVNPDMPGAPYLYANAQPPSTVGTAIGVNDGRLFMGGFDVSMPVFVTETSAGLTYAELARIFGHGTGLGLGFSGTWHLPDDLRLEAQLEQRVMGKYFIPNYFNTLYEAARLQQVGIPVRGDDLEALNSKRNLLIAQDRVRLGSFVTMAWRWKRMLRFRWSFEHAWNLKDSGWFHFDLRVKSPELPVYLRLTFDQLKTQSLQDLTISGNNLNFLRFEAAFKVLSMMMIGLGVKNSFEPDYENGLPVGLIKRRRIEPKLVLVMP